MAIERLVFRLIMLMISCWLLLTRMSSLHSKLLKNMWTNLKGENNKLLLFQNQLKLQLSQKLPMLKSKKMKENQNKRFKLNLLRLNKKKLNLLLRSKNKNLILTYLPLLHSGRKFFRRNRASKTGWHSINTL